MNVTMIHLPSLRFRRAAARVKERDAEIEAALTRTDAKFCGTLLKVPL
jgi:hypothetical protein